MPNVAAGALGETLVNSDLYLKQSCFSTASDLTELIFDNSIIEPAGLKTQYVLQLDEYDALQQMYEMLFSNSDYCVHHFGSLCYRYNRIKFRNHLPCTFIKIHKE